MKYAITKPRKLPSGKRASYWGVRIALESVYEEQAMGQLYPTLGRAPKGRKTEAETETWLHEIRKVIEHRAHLLALGMPVQDTKPIQDRIAEYIAWGQVQGGKKGLPWGEGHDRHQRDHLEWWVAELGLKTLSDVRQGAFDQGITRLAKRFAGNTVNHYGYALSGLCTWAARAGYLPTSPISFRALDKTPSRERGAFSLDELRSLFLGVPWGRSLLYRAAYYLRLRRNELASLRVSSVLWAEGLIKLAARDAKDRQEAWIPVPQKLLGDLYEVASGKEDRAPLFDFSKRHAARNLHRDMKALGIPVMMNGRRRDFHSLGASTATSMNRHGIAPALAQKTMRHKSFAQTEAYIKLESEEVRVVSQGLEDEIEHTTDTQEPPMRSASIQDGAGKGSGPQPLTLRHLIPRTSPRLPSPARSPLRRTPLPPWRGRTPPPPPLPP